MAFRDHGFLLLGGSGGIGSAIARQISAHGGKVLVAGRNAESIHRLAQELNCGSLVADLTNPGAIDLAVGEAIRTLGRLDGVANCLGSILLKAAHQTTDEEWDETLLKNLTSSFRLVRAFARASTGPGSIVLFSTVAARIGLANHEAIAAAKGGVQGLTLSAAATYASRGLRVNCIAPGLVDTPLASRLTSNEATLKASKAMHPLGRIGMPEDVAAAALWLLDPAMSWVTGQIIGVDGGLGSLRPR